MKPQPAIFHIARATLETVTPLSIASGKANGVFDTSLVMDANGLPTIPGSSLAGVLRHLYQAEYGKTGENALFGCQESEDCEKSQPSRLNVSWGCIQDSKGKAIQGLCLGTNRTALEQDSILNVALSLADAPVNRDRVKLNHKGASANTGKFDRAVLPAGYRFTVELSLWSDTANDAQWERALELLHHPLFRLGGSSRAGLGKLKVIEVQELITDLNQEAGRKIFTALSRDMDSKAGFKLRKISSNENSNTVVTATLTLKPNSYWRIGQGEKPNLQDSNGKTADLLPKLEQRINWQLNKAEGAAEQLLIPGSSVKGALSHRIAFHANRFSEQPRWADDMTEDKLNTYDKSEHCEEVQQLFGFANDEQRHSKQKGQAGFVFIDDAYQTFSKTDLQMIMHNSIDRFSGSVRDHMLFSEEMVWGKGVNLQLTIKKDAAITPTAKKALQHALDDLCQGRLALGAGVSKGHGLFTGNLKWSDGGKWIEGAE
jgi:CRISPR/Cas system CSM-associated protein Csm3 (group 7 of RAMP superfamily)